MAKSSPIQGIKSFHARWGSKKRYRMRALIFALLLFLIPSVHPQSAPTVNAPRPLDALGMSYTNLRTYLGSCEKECRQQSKEAELGHRAVFDLPPYTYTVESGKVVEVMITADSFEGFVAEGKETWGPPTSLVYQNWMSPFGTESRTGTARWELPGGVIVDAREAKIPGKVLGVTKLKSAGHSTVLFTQTEGPTDGAIVTISNPAPQNQKPKPTNVLGGPDKGPAISTVENPKPIPQ